MFDSSGEITAPCGAPITVSVTIPSSMTPARNQRRISRNARIAHALLYQLHQQFMVDRVEVALEIEIDHLVIAVGHPFADVVDRLPWPAFRPEPIRTRPEARLEQRFDDDAYRGLSHAILDSW